MNFALLLAEIANLLRPDPDGFRMKRLSAVSSAAVGSVVAQYADHTVRVEQLSARTGLTAAHFAHVFSEEMGISPMECGGDDYVERARHGVPALLPPARPPR